MTAERRQICRAWTVTRPARPLWQTWKPAAIWCSIEDAHAQRGHLLPLRHHRGAHGQQAVVREDGAAGRPGHRGRAGRARSSLCPSVLTRPITTGWRTSRDWCISRQLWWGHRIPAYYCDDCGEIIVAGEAARRAAPSAASTAAARTRTRWTPGSPPPCGRSPRWAGRTRPRTLKYFYPNQHAGHGLRHHLLLGRPA